MEIFRFSSFLNGFDKLVLMTSRGAYDVMSQWGNTTVSWDWSRSLRAVSAYRNSTSVSRSLVVGSGDEILVFGTTLSASGQGGVGPLGWVLRGKFGWKNFSCVKRLRWKYRFDTGKIFLIELSYPDYVLG